ncbi:Uncharacterized protein HSRCO_2614 [Halanaeroarchaeum sp. HSR-CO]|uniref:hypothetical protein n=1 Tax=Halanaeroarchaeum sp. HSR-CO TaxID=2866382 RepID=UPI00217ED2B7|nr:hypothetical protein [Halanaeroarchaeum sp. HSR-CO]UWG48874.1 Uncharacterized protein HSRCO_2614 [Halanaeroarchaeum sp. HSR-CO]
MTDLPCSRLLTWLQREYGDDLRVLLHYEESEYEWLYRRDDVRAQYDERSFDESVDTYREIEPLVREQSDILDGGALRATVNVYDDIVLLQFPMRPGEGVVVSLEATAGADLVEIVATGLQLLLADADAAQARMPDWVKQTD